MDLLTIILCIFLTFLIILTSYRYLTVSENPWKKAGIPVLSGWDALLAVNFNIFPIHLGLQSNYKKYGKLFGLHSYGNTILYTGDPELIRLVMVKDFQYFTNRLDLAFGDPTFDNMMSVARDENWKRIRNATSPAFSTGKIKKMFSIIQNCTETLHKNFDKVAGLETPTDVRKFINAFTMDATAIIAFGIKIDSLNDPDSPFMKAANEMFSSWGQLWIILVAIVNNILKFLHLTAFNLRITDSFEKLTKKVIEERKMSGQKRNDFLQLMLDAATSNLSDAAPIEKMDATVDSNENSNIEENTILQNGISQDKNIWVDRKGLNDDEIVSQCIIFMFGGFEPISSTTTFAIYELALNEHVQEELICEIDEVLRLGQKQLTYENVQNMKYLDNVIFETLRKYPSATITQRLAQANYKVPDTNIVIPKGTPVVVPVYALHHDEEYYPSPDTFDPNRFNADEKYRRDPYVYLPFGVGPRNCIAMRLALVEVKLCLASIMSRFRFRRCSKTIVPLKISTTTPQLSARDIFLVVEKREDAVI